MIYLIHIGVYGRTPSSRPHSQIAGGKFFKRVDIGFNLYIETFFVEYLSRAEQCGKRGVVFGFARYGKRILKVMPFLLKNGNALAVLSSARSVTVFVYEVVARVAGFVKLIILVVVFNVTVKMHVFGLSAVVFGISPVCSRHGTVYLLRVCAEITNH